MTDNEIIKALECCLDTSPSNCKNCPLFSVTNSTMVCSKIATKSAFDLINRLQANNEEKEDVIQYADKEIKRLNAEIERLTAHIQEGIDLAKQIPEMVATAQAEAIKEFAERLKRRMDYEEIWTGEDEYYYWYVTNDDIDELLKEMTERE